MLLSQLACDREKSKSKLDLRATGRERDIETVVEGVSESQHRNRKHHVMPGLHFFDKVHGINQNEGSAYHLLSKVQAALLFGDKSIWE